MISTLKRKTLIPGKQIFFLQELNPMDKRGRNENFIDTLSESVFKNKCNRDLNHLRPKYRFENINFSVV